MTDVMIALRVLLESADADLLREMIGFTAHRLMELEVAGLTGASHGERSAERGEISRAPAVFGTPPIATTAQVRTPIQSASARASSPHLDAGLCLGIAGPLSQYPATYSPSYEQPSDHGAGHSATARGAPLSARDAGLRQRNAGPSEG